MGGWVYIKSQNTVYTSDSGNPIYTRTRQVGYTNNVDWARWTPNLPHTGYYNVYVFAPHYTATMDISQQARYTISHAYGSTTVVKRQSDASGTWSYLGRYRFNAGTGGSVYIGDYTGDNPQHLISADNARFVWAP